MKKPPPVTETVATLTIHDAATLPIDERLRVAQWLRRQAHFFTAHADSFSGRYRARYLKRRPSHGQA